MRVAKAKMVFFFFNPQMDLGPNKQAQRVLILNSKGPSSIYTFNSILFVKYKQACLVRTLLINLKDLQESPHFTFLWMVGFDLIMAFVL